VKLIDFGFLLDLHRLDPAAPVAPADIPKAKYISPELVQIRERGLSFGDLARPAGPAAGLEPGEVLTRNDVWMLGQMFHRLLVSPDGVLFDSARSSSGAARRLAELGLPADAADQVCTLLYERVLVPVRGRIRDAQELARGLAEAVGEGVLEEGRARLLALAWPLLAPCPTPARPLHDAGAPGDGDASRTLFEADLDWVQAR
jgi:hypothetical protein